MQPNTPTLASDSRAQQSRLDIDKPQGRDPNEWVHPVSLILKQANLPEGAPFQRTLDAVHAQNFAFNAADAQNTKLRDGSKPIRYSDFQNTTAQVQKSEPADADNELQCIVLKSQVEQEKLATDLRLRERFEGGLQVIAGVEETLVAAATFFAAEGSTRLQDALHNTQQGAKTFVSGEPGTETALSKAIHNGVSTASAMVNRIPHLETSVSALEKCGYIDTAISTDTINKTLEALNTHN